MKDLKRKLLIFCALLFTTTANAAIITADATGDDNVDEADFWGVSFDSGTGFISSVTFDISSLGTDFFDFDGGSNFQNTPDPVITSTNGLSIADITAEYVGIAPQLFTLNFAQNTFSAGDSFRFGTDVDQLISGDSLAGLLFTATLQDGTTESGLFALTNITNQSAVQLTLDTVDVSAPSIYMLMGLSVVGLGLRKRLS